MPREETSDYVRPKGEGCTITIEASPGADRTEIAGVNPWRGALQIRIAEDPRQGRANDELLQFLSEKLSLRKSSITFVKGVRSSLKVLYIPLSADRVRAILGGGNAHS